MTPGEYAALEDLLLVHEGERLHPYDDGKGKITIGVGRNLTDVGISQRESRFLLGNDLATVLTDLQTFPWFRSLDAGRARAVADFRFNVGPGTFRTFAHFIAAMARANYQVASDELASSLWAKQVQPSRVKDLRELIENGDA